MTPRGSRQTLYQEELTQYQGFFVMLALYYFCTPPTSPFTFSQPYPADVISSHMMCSSHAAKRHCSCVAITRTVECHPARVQDTGGHQPRLTHYFAIQLASRRRPHHLASKKERSSPSLAWGFMYQLPSLHQAPGATFCHTRH